MFKPILFSVICSVSLAGCVQVNSSQAPIATAFPTSQQKKMQAAAHWEVLAANEALKISKVWKGNTSSLYLVPTGSLPFDRAFQDIFTSQLIQNGLSLKNSPVGASQIHYKTQVIKQKDRDTVRPPIGTLTMLAAGITVATQAVNHWSNPATVLIPVAVGADLLAGNVISQSNSEVIITTQIIDNTNILYSSSNIYYINAKDSVHYQKLSSSSVTIPLTDQE